MSKLPLNKLFQCQRFILIYSTPVLYSNIYCILTLILLFTAERMYESKILNNLSSAIAYKYKNVKTVFKQSISMPAIYIKSMVFLKRVIIIFSSTAVGLKEYIEFKESESITAATCCILHRQNIMSKLSFKLKQIVSRPTSYTNINTQYKIKVFLYI